MANGRICTIPSCNTFIYPCQKMSKKTFRNSNSKELLFFSELSRIYSRCPMSGRFISDSETYSRNEKVRYVLGLLVPVAGTGSCWSKMTNRLPACVIDNGTGYTKIGFAGNTEPQFIMPSGYFDYGTDISSLRILMMGMENWQAHSPKLKLLELKVHAVQRSTTKPRLNMMMADVGSVLSQFYGGLRVRAHFVNLSVNLCWSFIYTMRIFQKKFIGIVFVRLYNKPTYIDTYLRYHN